MKIDRLNFVDKAERVIKELNSPKDRKGSRLTTSKIRNLLSMVSELQIDAQHCTNDKLSDGMIVRVQYLKMRIVYEAGREKVVKEFVEKAELIPQIEEIGQDRQKLILFCNYMEALVAYHKFHGGSEY